MGEPSTEDELNSLIRWAGLSTEQAENAPFVRSLEITLEAFTNMSLVSRFQNLKSLTLVACNISEIEGLTHLDFLEELWLNQNEIKRISGLNSSQNLKILDLSQNYIKEIEGLYACVNLERLILNENYIESLEGLNTASLKILHVARNRIYRINGYFGDLQELNLAGNYIGSFKELLNLEPVSSLRVLLFNDPHFMENPVCNLCNYETYLLYHLPELTHLDSLAVAEEAKNYAEATFMKKKMYYNMRIKTIKRTTSTITKIVEETSFSFEKKIFDELKPIEKTLTMTEKEIHERQGFIHDHQESTFDLLEPESLMKQLKSKADSIKYSLQKEYMYLKRIEQKRNSLKHKIKRACNENIQKLVTELETGGNIRYEEGKPTDNWYSSCADLVNSRYRKHQNLEVKVTKVTRIHNRFLRHRFEEKLDNLVNVAEASYKKNLEYLFFGINEHGQEEMTWTIEEGFRTPEEYRNMGLPACIPLTNSLNTADLARIRQLQEGIDKIFQAPGQILVCKVYIGTCLEDEQEFLNTQSLAEIWHLNVIEEPSDCWCVSKNNRYDPKFKVWFMFDRALVLPEYLVEFEYCERPTYTEYEIGFEKEIQKAELGSLNLSLQAFMELCSEHTVGVPEFQGPDLPIKMYEKELSEEFIQILTDKNPEALDLSHNDFSSCARLGVCRDLKYLYISFNQLTSLIGVTACRQLLHLDISHNRISSLKHLTLLSRLDYLNISHNMIDNIREIFQLDMNLSSLVMIGNPLFFHPRYRELVLMKVLTLNELDMAPVSKEEREKSREINMNITRDLLEVHSSICDIASPSILLSAEELKRSTGVFGNRIQFVTILSLNRQRLISIEGIGILPNLKQASFIGNFIEDLHPIEDCPLIEELSLEENLLSNIDPLSSLSRLKKIDLGKNFIEELSGLKSLTSLNQLSVEDNQIHSLADLEVLSGLMELYIGNNRISNIKEIELLKHLPKLIILDITGNPISESETSRLYIIFNLKRLKVLDGASIEAPEQALSKQTFGGRLTDDVLFNKLNGIATSEIRQLDLSNSKLRSFDNMINSDLFPCVSEINLSSNLLQDLNFLGLMPQLTKLTLSRNRLDSLTSSENRGFSAVVHLDTLDLSHNQIKSLSAFYTAELSRLRVLILSHNQLTKLEFLDKLQNLRELDVSSNMIRQLEPHSFTSPLSLKFIKLDDNRIRYLSYFGKLQKLECLELVSNRIHELQEIDKLKDLSSLMELILTNNPITRKNPYRINIIKKLPHLMFLDTVEISYEEKERVEFMYEPKPSPLVHVVEQPPPKVAVKVNSVNFESVFAHEPKRPVSGAPLGSVLGVTALNSSLKTASAEVINT